MKKKFGSRKQLHSDMVLQITSMADIFTIILVFLLKNFSTGATSLSPASNMTLPEAKKANPIVDIVKVEVSSSGIVLEDKNILQLNQFQISPADLEPNGTPRALNEALDRYKKRNSLQNYSKMLVLADEATPYLTLKRVLTAASNRGFSDYKLVIVEGE